MKKPGYKIKKLLGAIFSTSQTIRWATQGRILHTIWKRHSSIPKACLDVGCGGGSYAIENFLRRGFHTTLCDYSPELLEIAKRQVTEANFSVLANFSECSAEELPFPDASYDRIQCLEVLEHLQNPKKALQEMRRVAKKNARLVISVPHPPEWFPNPGHVVEGYRAEEISALMESAGWKVVEIQYCMLILTRLIFQAKRRVRFPLPLNPVARLENLIPQKWRKQLLPYDIIVVAEVEN